MIDILGLLVENEEKSKRIYYTSEIKIKGIETNSFCIEYVQYYKEKTISIFWKAIGLYVYKYENATENILIDYGGWAIYLKDELEHLEEQIEHS